MRYGVLILMIGSFFFALSALMIPQTGAYPPPTQLPVEPISQASSLQLPESSVTAGETILNGTNPTLGNIPGVTPSYPKTYPQNNIFPHEELDCERMAKEGQRLYGGDLIFLLGKDERGQYILGDYAGHWLNYIYIPELGKKQYIDYQTKQVYDDIKDVLFFFKYSKDYYDAEAFNINVGERPIGVSIKWHY